MGKRMSSGGKAASPAKAQRPEPAPTKADPLLEACQPVFKVLRTCGLSEASITNADMLCAALPLALKVSQGVENRHEFQERILDAVADEVSEVVARQKEALLAVEKQAADLEAERVQSTTIQEGISARIAETLKEVSDTKEVMKRKQGTLNEAQAALEVAKQKVETADAERQALEQTRDDFIAGLEGLWAPLKASGKDWRLRNSMLGKLTEKLKQIGVEESLLAALQVAFKTAASARSEFALTAIAAAEEAYAKHIDVLKERVTCFAEQEMSARTAAVTDADAQAKTAQEALDTAIEANVAAQNAWLAETTAEAEHKTKMIAYAPTAAELEQKGVAARAELASLEEVCSGFEALRAIEKVKALEQGVSAEAAP